MESSTAIDNGNGYHACAVQRDDFVVMSFAYDLMREYLRQSLESRSSTSLPVSQ